MKYWIAFGVVATLTLAAACASGQEVEQKIVLPLNPVQPVPIEPVVPLPVPPPQPPRVVDTLSIDQIWVVESTVELFVRQYPTGLLEVDSESGPIRVRGKFADGSGQNETREYKGDHVYLITAAKSGVVMLDLVPSGVTVESDIVRQVLTVIGPRPPPEPPIPPVPTPDPGPVTPTKIQVVIIEDPALRGSLPAEQIAAMDGSDVREYAKTHCLVTNGTPDFRKLSLRQDVSQQPEWIRTAFSQPRSTLPMLIILTPTKTIAGPMPKTIAETMTVLRTYGGQ